MKHLSAEQKHKILAYYEIKYSGSEISKLLGIAISTVNRIIAKFKKNKTVQRCKGSGRPKILAEEDKRFILNEIDKNPKISLRKVAKKLSLSNEKIVSINTIRSALHNNGIECHSPIKKPFLRPIHIEKRFDICGRILKMPERIAKTIIFSDESKFNLFYSDGQQYVWRNKNSGLENKNLSKTIKGGGGSVMVWACFSHYGIGTIKIIEETMTGPVYVDILSRNLYESAEKMGLKSFIFQQDNDPKHTSRIAKEFFEENDIKVLDWPAQSPDLNPIEHLWAYLKVKISERMPKNISELKRYIIEEWDKIPMEMCKKYALSFKNRALAIYNAMGNHTHY